MVRGVRTWSVWRDLFAIYRHRIHTFDFARQIHPSLLPVLKPSKSPSFQNELLTDGFVDPECCSGPPRHITKCLKLASNHEGAAVLHRDTASTFQSLMLFLREIRSGGVGMARDGVLPVVVGGYKAIVHSRFLCEWILRNNITATKELGKAYACIPHTHSLAPRSYGSSTLHNTRPVTSPHHHVAIHVQLSLILFLHSTPLIFYLIHILGHICHNKPQSIELVRSPAIDHCSTSTAPVHRSRGTTLLPYGLQPKGSGGKTDKCD